MPELMPWEKPLTKPLPEPMRCLGCNRHGRELLEAGIGWATGSEFHGIGVCATCAIDEDLRAEYVAARNALWNVKREDDRHPTELASVVPGFRTTPPIDKPIDVVQRPESTETSSVGMKGTP